MVSEGTTQSRHSNRESEPGSVTQWLGKAAGILTFLFPFFFQCLVQISSQPMSTLLGIMPCSDKRQSQQADLA